MTPKVKTVMTKRKQLRKKGNLKAMTQKVTVTPTKKKSFKKNPWNPVIIFKLEMCLPLRWQNVQAAFGTITFLSVPLVVTKFLLMPNI